ncbi:MAG: energy transducer TonB [Geoalkalibacter sp.]|uniref:energy transducer TonB n=1 Tax=Geoalkalibacter sp. TaxID=3041440 RepID=UPI003D0B0C85
MASNAATDPEAIVSKVDSLTPEPSESVSSQVAEESAGEDSPFQAEQMRQARQDYLLSLRNLIAQYRRYPLPARRAGQEGIAVVRFILHPSGELLECEVLAASGIPLLDRAALSTVRNAAPFPPPPPELGEKPLTCEIPIEFSLTR